MFKTAKRTLGVIFGVACMSLLGAVPGLAASSSDGADAIHQTTCLPSGTSTVCITYHSVINDVETPRGVHAFTQSTRANVTATSTTSGAFLYSTTDTFQNRVVYAQGEFKVIVAHFTFRATVPGFGTCTQHSDSVYANGEVRFTNVSYECR